MRIPILIFASTLTLGSSWAIAAAPISVKSLVGFWQAESPDISDAYPDCYRFFADGTFVFIFSGYDETKRIASLHGNYSMKVYSDKDAVLSFFVTSRVELKGGTVERNPQSSNGWYLVNAKPVTVIQVNSGPDEAPVRLNSLSPKGHLCIEIGGTKFYRISSNPKHLLN